MPQTAITYNGIQGQPGQAFDASATNRDVVSVIAAVNIPFGAACELNANGQAVPLQDATTGAAFLPSIIGVCIIDPFGAEEAYQTFTVPNTGAGSAAVGYLAGQSVPFMRKGRVWVLTDGAGTYTRYGAVNVWHSSTGAHPQGVFTMSAVSIVAGSEIDIAPSCIVWNPQLVGGATGPSFTDSFGTTFTTLVVEINL